MIGILTFSRLLAIALAHNLPNVARPHSQTPVLCELSDCRLGASGDRTLRVGRLTITYSSPIPGILALLRLRLLFECDR